jgi:hypothetical protein
MIVGIQMKVIVIGIDMILGAILDLETTIIAAVVVDIMTTIDIETIDPHQDIVVDILAIHHQDV